MEEFCHLFRLLDASTSTEAKVQALLAFFRRAPAAEAAWALHGLLGLQKRRLITGRRLREIGQEVAPWPAWLFDACYRQVGDSAETISLLWPGPGDSPGATPGDSAGVSAGDSASDSSGVAAASKAARSLADRAEGTFADRAEGSLADRAEGSLADWMERRLPALARLQGEDQAEAVRACWRGLSREQLLVVNKLLTGGLRVGVSQGLVVRALARLSGLEEATVKHRLMGGFVPATGAWEALLAPVETGSVPASRPYPFFLASPLEPTKLLDTPPHHWQVEWKYDGIRCQLIHRQGEVFLWSRGEDLINASFPELTAAASALPRGLVLDGEVVIWGPEDTTPRPFAALQRRLGRLAPGKRQLQQLPACFVIYDLLEFRSEDLRERPLQERRQRLEDLDRGGLPAPLRLAPLLPLEEWPALEALRAQARQEGAEGVMLKRRASPYLSGRRRGHWWKHKLEPFRLDAVLVYAQAGSGRRANLLTDYTFALWDRPWEEGEAAEPQGDTAGHRPPPRLVTFAKAYSGLDDQEILRLDQWIRRHTLQRFGPVRAVAPDLVFELAFEGLQPSARHRSGLAARFPRISRWRTDKGARDADSLVQALALMTPPALAGPDQ